MLIIKSLQDIPDVIKPGEQIYVDVFAGPDEEDQLPTEQQIELANQIFEEIEKRLNTPQPRTFEAFFDNKFFVITAKSEGEYQLSGDVTDRTISLDSGETKKYKLTSEGNQFVSVNGEKFSY